MNTRMISHISIIVLVILFICASIANGIWDKKFDLITIIGALTLFVGQRTASYGIDSKFNSKPFEKPISGPNLGVNKNEQD